MYIIIINLYFSGIGLVVGELFGDEQEPIG